MIDINYSLVSVPKVECNQDLLSLICYALNKIDKNYLISPASDPLPSLPDLDNTSLAVPDQPIAALQRLELSQRQVDYLTARLAGKSIYDCIGNDAVTPIELVLWTDNQLFAACNAILKESDTILAEALAWDIAGKDRNAMAERAFTIKSQRPEYRDNVTPPLRGTANIKIMLVDGKAIKEYDISANSDTAD